ncbi:hypothetical protein [Sphingomonas sp. VL_57B]|jgi:hypothetical protein|uniref:hypothetical protein n=1 Tax=unclassified Sphingomonas TaxID=196159 RepID=UPI0031F48D95
MGSDTTGYETGEIIAWSAGPDGEAEITAAVTLPVSQWDRVTDWINDLHHWEGEARPEIPLEARITEHLDLQTQIWAHDARQRLGETIEDLDDDVPF